MESISLKDPVVQSYIFYSAVLAIKLFMVAALTARVRMAKKVFANEEDAKAIKGKVKLDDPDVERVRRAHLNDLENIPAFWILGALYVTTAPAVWWAKILFRAFAAGRIIHTFVYAIKPLPQPARGIAFGIPLVINMYMGVQVILYYLSAM
jgi:glutathione S-transferase